MPSYAGRDLVMLLFGLGESFWVTPLFAPTTNEPYERLGLNDLSRIYFATRAAPLGTVPPEVVTATFFGFHPAKIARYIPSVWEHATPAEALDAQYSVADRTLRDHLGDWTDSADARQAADLVRIAAQDREVAGRPLFASYAALPWPDPAATHLTLLHGFTLLREYRGDSHIGVLIAGDIDACECHLLLYAAVAGGCDCHSHFARGGLRVDVVTPPNPQVLTDREWPVQDRQAALARLCERGLLTEDGTITAEGMALHTDLERDTDRAATVRWERDHTDSIEQLARLMREPAKVLRQTWNLGGGRLASRSNSKGS
ncbi:MAG TPA: hypothetical protein VFE65_00405 [Pseudonocardia sp.]|jgi:hypothetical protein|nr:hypothetical protein [Pseudonocardia sp.]